VGITVNREQVQKQYPRVDLEGFVPTHHVLLFDARTNSTLREDFVRLVGPDEHGIRTGFIPGDDEPWYSVLSTDLWQCLNTHGRVKVKAIKYVPDYIRLKKRRGLVYFVQRGLDGPVKIGWSQDVPRRMSELQVANAEKLRLLGTVEGTMEDEEATHVRFSHLRMNAEWFRCTEEISTHLRNLGGEAPIVDAN
jgi:hypothetical protein